MDHSESRNRIRIAALLFLVMAGFYWKLTLTRQFEWMSGPDLAEQVLPWFHVQAQEWHAGRFPLWDPFLWGGQPLFGQAQPGAAYPLNWILFLLPLEQGHIAGWALAWYYVAIHLMAAGFCYLFCRSLGCSRSASLSGGLIFSLSGYLGNTAWPQMINGAVWIPLVFLFQLRASRSPRPAANAALSGMFLGVAFLSGHHQIPIFTAVASAGVWLYLLARNRRLLAPAAVALLFAGLSGAMQTLPAYEYGRLAKRWVGAAEAITWGQPVPYSVHAYYDLKPFSLFGIVFPGVKAHFDPFLGVVAFSLALFAVTALWRNARVRLLAALALAAILYGLGHNSVFQGALYGLIPELDKARSTSAVVVLFQFAAAALAAFGIDQLAASWTARGTWILAGFGALTLAISEAVIFANKLTFPADDRVILTAFIALLAAALFSAWRSNALTDTQGRVLLVLLLLLELGNTGQYGFADRSDRNQMQWLDKTHANADIGEYLRKQPGFQRAEIGGDAFAPNWGAFHGVEMHGGKTASITTNVLQSELFSLTGRRMYGVAYTLARAPQPNAGDEVFAGASGMKVYRRDAFPRAWAVHELIRVPNATEGNILVGQDPESFRRKAHMVGMPPRVEPCAAPDTVKIVERLPDRLAIRAEMACDGMVVLSDTFYPGWRARVDHRPAQIHEVNGAMRGVAVPRGTHTITMRYRPVSVYLGAALTLLGILGALALGLRRTPQAS
ncbi:MAG: YfhO family protein [Candidatus Solibacter sp.]|nr:YfhO family protein [Candidatus Solibacter sp.]